jgi:uncharacterized membrane protein
VDARDVMVVASRDGYVSTTPDPATMTKTRLEAFSDAVIAIVMTILVLELKVPPGSDWAIL